MFVFAWWVVYVGVLVRCMSVAVLCLDVVIGTNVVYV